MKITENRITRNGIMSTSVDTIIMIIVLVYLIIFIFSIRRMVTVAEPM